MNIALAGLLYSAASSSLIVANKWALIQFPYPCTLLAVQFSIASVVTLVVIACAGRRPVMPSVHLMAWICALVLLFLLAILTNMYALKHSTVDLVILFRSMSVFPLALVDYALLNRILPSRTTIVSLVSLNMGALFVLRHIHGMSATATTAEHAVDWYGWAWLVSYFLVVAIDSIVSKLFLHNSAVSHLSTNDRVLLLNFGSIGPALALAHVQGEFESLRDTSSLVSTNMLLHIAPPMLISGFLGTVLSYLAWILREKLTTLSFTVLCIVNKILSVALNGLFFSHLPLRCMLLVCLSLISAAFYEEPPRKKPQSSSIKDKTIDVAETGMVVGNDDDEQRQVETKALDDVDEDDVAIGVKQGKLELMMRALAKIENKFQWSVLCGFFILVVGLTDVQLFNFDSSK